MQNRYPQKKFLETLSFILPAKTTVLYTIRPTGVWNWLDDSPPLTNKIKNCEYIDNSFKLLNTESKGILISLQINVRSLHKNFDLLYEFIESLNFNPHVICLSETVLKRIPSLISN